VYRIEFANEVFSDLDKLTDEIALEVKHYFHLYETDPYRYSQKLYNQGTLHLEGYRKTYLANATYRIVLKIEDNIAQIVEVVAVGKREDMQVYRDAYERVR